MERTLDGKARSNRGVWKSAVAASIGLWKCGIAQWKSALACVAA
jgi:hypothetical protein